MEAAPFLLDLVVLLSSALPLVLVCHRLGVPALVGFLAAGIVIGPSATGLISSTERVHLLAEIGVVLLLFTIGLEFSLRRLMSMARRLVGAGSLQMGIVAVATVVVAALCGYGPVKCVLFACIASLSSTAVALTWLESRGEVLSAHGSFSLAILLFQDLCVLPMMIGISLLAHGEDVSPGDAALRLVGSVAVIAIFLWIARSALPWLLEQLLRLRSRELFVGTVLVICFGTAWLTAQLGLSLAIGAFLAGLIVSESEYSHQAVADILPLRDLFSSVFFVSIGMLLDLRFVAEHWPVVIAIAVGLMVVKTIAGVAAVFPFRASPRLALLVGVALAQVGEFSFVIAGEAAAAGALTQAELQGVIAVSVLTMLVSPIAAHAAAAFSLGRELPGPGVDQDDDGDGRPARAPHGHVVVVGYGLHGRQLVEVLKAAGIPYGIVDLDAEAVSAARDRGEQAVYGDATRSVVLQHVWANSAAAVVVTVADPAAARRITALTRSINETAALVVRTRHVAEIDELYALGATVVVPEELETSVEIFARVLECLGIPANVVAAQVDVVRSGHYALLRGHGGTKRYMDRIYEMFAAATTVTHLIREGSAAAGRSLADIDLRGRTGVTLVALVREGSPVAKPPSNFEVARGDVFVLVGSHAQLASARALLEPVEEPPADADDHRAPDSER